MLGAVYLIIATLVGFVLCKLFLSNLETVTLSTYKGKKINLSPYLVLVPAWFLVGTVLISWTSYILACVLQSFENPLFIANIIAMVLMLVISGIGIIILYRNYELNLPGFKKSHFTKVEIILIFVTLAFTTFLMWLTLYVSDGELSVGLSVFSDFSPHLGMIRSFSHGNNFPTSYTYFASNDIKYHFMFQFLVGNLESLGMRIDFAMNIPSIIGFISTVILLYVLAVKLSGKKMVGTLSCLFFAFRSSKSLFTFISNLPKESDLVEELILNKEFIGSTPNESWGLWNINVYLNQRHLAFAIPALLIVLIIFIQRVYDGYARYLLLRKTRKDSLKVAEAEDNEEIANLDLDSEVEDTKKKKLDEDYEEPSLIFPTFKNSVFNKEGWLPDDLKGTVFLGFFLGAMGFFNGAVVIATLCILFFLAIVADRRLEFAIVAAIAIGLSYVQTLVFIDGSMITSTEGIFKFGFIAENKTLFGSIDYLQRLLGIMPLLLIISFITIRSIRRYILFAFSAPLLFAFCFSLTVDVTVNHKYIMLSVMLLNIFVAILITKIFENRTSVLIVTTLALIFLMTSTGIYDFITVVRKNMPENNIKLEMDNDITNWVFDNATKDDIFLTSNYAINQFTIAGAKMFLGWPYFAWSAGYDTTGREKVVKKMYEASNSVQLDGLIKQNNITYIVVDHDNRVSTDYELNENIIDNTYEAVFTTGENEWKTTIYDTSRRKNSN